MNVFFLNEKFPNIEFAITLKYGKRFFTSEKLRLNMTFNYEIMCPRSCHFVLLMLLFLLLIIWLNLVWRHMKVIDLGDHLGYFQSRLKSFLYFLKKKCFLYFGNWKFLKDLFSTSFLKYIFSFKTDPSKEFLSHYFLK